MRQHRIDAFRVYAIFIVICAHIQFFGWLDDDGRIAKLLEFGCILIVRWVIPFFFIVSGYFVGGKMVREPSKAKSIAIKYTRKLAEIFLFWWVVYAIENSEHFFQLLKDDPLGLIFDETQVHLWFLHFLILTVWLFAL